MQKAPNELAEFDSPFVEGAGEYTGFNHSYGSPHHKSGGSFNSDNQNKNAELAAYNSQSSARNEGSQDSFLIAGLRQAIEVKEQQLQKAEANIETLKEKIAFRDKEINTLKAKEAQLESTLLQMTE